jgi:hypothetical protein
MRETQRVHSLGITSGRLKGERRKKISARVGKKFDVTGRILEGNHRK